ncbi:MAG: hypothetical protein AAF078_06950 [Planctomycetota bacterium]
MVQPVHQPKRAAGKTAAPVELSLDKGGRTLVYRCDAGHEPDLIRQLADEAADPNCPLTWFDAAVLCHRVGLSLRRVLQDRSLPPRSSAPSRAAESI